MRGLAKAWAPAVLLALGAVVTLGVDTQRSMRLRAPLAATVPAQVASHGSQDVIISEDEQRVAGMSDYLMRVYRPSAAAAGAAGAYAFSVYVGYYQNQTQGRTIHSPRNCLPGAGWEALTSSRVAVAAPGGPVTVNRYLLQNKGQRALVLYWYQGRGRVEANEYLVKWHLLRDSALRGRSDEALVRVIVPVTGSEDEAFALASRVAGEMVPAVDRALPAA
ncbi:MAG TPA: EpsI family protein [Longimicrobiaceae bacterium]|nr:EpsI family protein [Longimicrobiaceae bacterium]